MHDKPIKWHHYLVIAILLIILSIISLAIGTGEISLLAIISGRATLNEINLLFVSRLPRTITIIISGASLAIGGLIMQALMQNRFVEPATTGVTESASLGLLIATIFFPNSDLLMKMIIAIIFAIVGTLILMNIIQHLGQGQIFVVPLLGIILSGIVGAIDDYLAWQFNLQMTLQSWSLGDFSGVLRGRYELIYFSIILLVVAYLFAERFTIVSLGKDIATNLGLNYQTISLLGIIIVSFISAISLVVIGTLPFLGIVVPNIISLIYGDNLKNSLPIVAMSGAIFVLVSDIIARSIIYPAEIPVGVVIGVIGAGLFLLLLYYLNKKPVSSGDDALEKN